MSLSALFSLVYIGYNMYGSSRIKKNRKTIIMYGELLNNSRIEAGRRSGRSTRMGIYGGSDGLEL